MDHTQYTTNKADRKPGKHLTREDRGAIEAMKKLGHSNRAIARYLNCSATTVSNELMRGTRPKNGRSGRTPGYCAKRGMLVCQTHRANGKSLWIPFRQVSNFILQSAPIFGTASSSGRNPGREGQGRRS